MQARDVMTTQITTVTADTAVQDAAQLMLEKGISGLPVVDAEGRLRGMVSEGDLIRRSESGTASRQRSWWLRLISSQDLDAKDYVKSHGARVEDVMTHPVTSVTADTDVSEIAMLLEKQRIKRVPVLEEGRLVGLVSRADILRLLATSKVTASATAADDSSIRKALMEHLDQQPWSTGLVNVVVQDGIVNLWGMYDSEEQREAYRVAARNAPGSKGVEDHLQQALEY